MSHPNCPSFQNQPVLCHQDMVLPEVGLQDAQTALGSVKAGLSFSGGKYKDFFSYTSQTHALQGIFKISDFVAVNFELECMWLALFKLKSRRTPNT